MADWAHSPVHRLTEAGAYIITAGTYQKIHIFDNADKLTFVRDALLSLASSYSWNLEAWAIMSNHYHFIVTPLENCVQSKGKPSHPRSLQRLIAHLHSITAREVNIIDKKPGRKVWFQYWDTHLTYERSYLARLNYVHNNPAHHKLVANANDYEWCSAKWFETEANKSFFKTVMSFKIDKVNIKDDF